LLLLFRNDRSLDKPKALSLSLPLQDHDDADDDTGVVGVDGF
jgi:hypothetical protein